MRSIAPLSRVYTLFYVLFYFSPAAARHKKKYTLTNLRPSMGAAAAGLFFDFSIFTPAAAWQKKTLVFIARAFIRFAIPA